jgi:hypothetical protein
MSKTHKDLVQFKAKQHHNHAQATQAWRPIQARAGTEARVEVRS